MTYQQALKSAKKTGIKDAVPLAFLASMCHTLSYIHAINPALVFEGAKKQGLTGRDLGNLAVKDPLALGDLMFL